MKKQNNLKHILLYFIQQKKLGNKRTERLFTIVILKQENKEKSSSNDR